MSLPGHFSVQIYSEIIFWEKSNIFGVLEPFKVNYQDRVGIRL